MGVYWGALTQINVKNRGNTSPPFLTDQLTQEKRLWKRSHASSFPLSTSVHLKPYPKWCGHRYRFTNRNLLSIDTQNTRVKTFRVQSFWKCSYFNHNEGWRKLCSSMLCLNSTVIIICKPWSIVNFNLLSLRESPLAIQEQNPWCDYSLKWHWIIDVRISGLCNVESLPTRRLCVSVPKGFSYFQITQRNFVCIFE